jgi:exopolyphosphatase/guanosine-5'-triphosphate,3'-diphosphate pyrophosphatase
VVVRDSDEQPVVIRNAPLLHDGTPMPTRYWLVGPAEKRAVDRLEAAGGVRRAEAALSPDEVRRAHDLYAAERDAALPTGWVGPRPSGGVGGTRQGVKCLHAHYAWFLAGGPDPVGRWVAGQLGDGPPGRREPHGERTAPAAAIDCGTNSTRLLVAHPGQPALTRLMRITRLGEGVDRTKRLAPAAIERTVAVLAEYRSAMDRYEVGAIRMTATSAARDALNREEFFAGAEAAVGVRPELLDGSEEARLSFVGATYELPPPTGPWLVADLGGGSTELAAGSDPDAGPLASWSLDMGCVRVTERFLAADPPTADQLRQARNFADGLLDDAVRAQPGLLAVRTLVGLAGTVAALAAFDQGLPGYERDRVHHYRLRRKRVDAALSRLASTDAAGRRAMPGIEPERADVIVGGTVILAAIMDRFGFDECLTSEADILDGLVLSTRPGSGLPTV